MQKLSADLRTSMPEAKCFSLNNLYYVRAFYKLYADRVIFHQAEGKLGISWGQAPQSAIQF